MRRESQVDPRTVALFTGGDLVLDLGCGEGVWLDWVAPRYRRAIGIDNATERLAAREQAPSDWKFVLADLGGGIPVETGSADGVHANQVIEHMLNPLAFVLEVRRVLRSGGLFVATTPNVRYLKHVARLLVAGRGPMTSGRAQRTPYDWDDGHVHYLTPYDLRWLAREAGFSQFSVRALIAPHGELGSLRPLLERHATSWPVREFLSGNSLLVAHA